MTNFTHAFYHPDCTVGSGITPDQPLARVADYQANAGLSLPVGNFTLPRRHRFSLAIHNGCTASNYSLYSYML